MGTTIYYFSGTGNSLKIAKDLSLELTDSKLIRICKKNMIINCNMESDRIGVVFPVYHWGLPLMVQKFLENLQIKPDAYFFAVANYGGGAGISFEQLEQIMRDKEIRLSSAFSLYMPGNLWFIQYPHKIYLTRQRLDDQSAATRQIAKAIKAMAIVPAVLSTTRAIDAERHQAFNPYSMDEDFWVDENCSGCSICSKICPANNIIISDKKPAWQHQCEQCMACIHWCPSQSIQIKDLSVNKDRYHHPDIKVQDLFHSKP